MHVPFASYSDLAVTSLITSIEVTEDALLDGEYFAVSRFSELAVTGQ